MLPDHRCLGGFGRGSAGSEPSDGEDDHTGGEHRRKPEKACADVAQHPGGLIDAAIHRGDAKQQRAHVARHKDVGERQDYPSDHIAETGLSRCVFLIHFSSRSRERLLYL